MTSFKDILRGAVTRFLPGWFLAMAGFPLIFAPRTFSELGPMQFQFLATYTGAALAGYVSSLLAMRSRLRADAGIVSRKSVVVGASSVGAVLITSSLPHDFRSYANILMTYFVVSGGVTLALYAPWLKGKAAAPPFVETAV